ncbi:hypothetical protein D4764_17G0007440 [Takifugu flavidus]|uniref:Uncharacterized protein n=1 Tax=Takifugu flavidus TaxID=433684 RepID=A0A5C6NXB5_9TELE|nr:hypothetical protein D4764_17G0007440 [Takifugu flavidus]
MRRGKQMMDDAVLKTVRAAPPRLAALSEFSSVSRRRQLAGQQPCLGVLSSRKCERCDWLLFQPVTFRHRSGSEISFE